MTAHLGPLMSSRLLLYITFYIAPCASSSQIMIFKLKSEQTHDQHAQYVQYQYIIMMYYIVHPDAANPTLRLMC
jgi:hypothetical protein